MDDPIGRWLLELLLLLLAALAGAAQEAFKNANESKLREMADENPRAEKLLKLMERPKSTLTALRGFRTFLLMLAAALAAAMFPALGRELSALLCCLAAAPAAMIFCKLVPEKLARRQAERTALSLYSMLLLVTRVLAPLTWLEQGIARGILRLLGVDPRAKDEEVTQEEIRAMVDIGEESGVIESDEHEMIKNVFDFGDLTAADCMTHRTDVTALWVEDDADTILSTIKESGLSRFPVYNEDIDDVIGVLATRDYLLNAKEPQPRPLRELLREPYFVPETVPSDVLLRNMQRAKVHLAIVVDEYGGMSGIITMEDLLEEIVGNIYDEFDPTAETNIEKLGENTWRVSGTTDLETLGEELHVTLPQSEDYDTLSGLVFSRFALIPEDGSTPEITIYCTEDGEKPAEDADEPVDQLRIQVEKIEDRRVEWAKVTLLPARTEADRDEPKKD